MPNKITEKFPHLQDKAALETAILKQTAASARAEGINAHVIDGQLVVLAEGQTIQSPGKNRSEKS